MAHVDRLTDRVVDEGFGVGLFHGRHDLGESERDAGRNFGVQVVRAAIGHMDFAVHDVRIRTGDGGVKRPLELPECQGQTAERDIAAGAWIAQPLGFAGKVSRHFGQQIRLIEIECFAELEWSERPIASSPGRPSWKTAVGWPLESVPW